MGRRFRVGLALVPFVTALVTAQEPVPPALRAMADTELAFAAAARVKGIRDSFLEFFAADAIAFDPGPVSAREQLSARPGVPFAVRELTWEPRTGDLAASGDLGWLTGPSTFINHEAADKTPRYGNYLSVWRKQPDGNWRVFIDVGTNVPSPAPFAPGFTAFAFGGAKYTGREGKQAATASLSAADRDLNDRIAAQGASAAFAERVRQTTRLHRNGMLPLIGRDAIAAWFKEHGTGMRAVAGAAEAAASGDFGYTYGTFELATPKPQKGAYVRLWHRDRSGRWFIVVDVVA
jgi:ketosteroid isomerase-like protein